MMSQGAQYQEMRPITALNDKNIVQIACGGYHSLVLTGKYIIYYQYVAFIGVLNFFCDTDRGEVFGFGAGNYGQLGTGSAVTKSLLVPSKALAGKQINFIAAGPSHSIAISTDGKVSRSETHLSVLSKYTQ